MPVAAAIWIADAHRDGKRFVVRVDQKLTAFLELGAAVRAASRQNLSWLLHRASGWPYRLVGSL